MGLTCTLPVESDWTCGVHVSCCTLTSILVHALETSFSVIALMMPFATLILPFDDSDAYEVELQSLGHLLIPQLDMK